ncbi:hypothetical protein C2S53_016528 [Perilla frutescens var. hirtella]|uniref:Uncharacterized protein n=1 Tax=Perilla frutescens var. hirtella TaxID=608512 RepID=A0AAD4PDM2_PERFH|nr:hypothetical protein C2S53_016528 [Perilla frutescens var. hirtella]
MMPLKLFHAHLHTLLPTAKLLPPSTLFTAPAVLRLKNGTATMTTTSTAQLRNRRQRFPTAAFSASSAPLDLTEENIEQLAQLFDASVNITGKAELAELDGPYVKIRLSGRFWHERSLVLARLGNYLKQRIPEILEVDIEDEKQLDDSPANF